MRNMILAVLTAFMLGSCEKGYTEKMPSTVVEPDSVCCIVSTPQLQNSPDEKDRLVFYYTIGGQRFIGRLTGYQGDWLAPLP